MKYYFTIAAIFCFSISSIMAQQRPNIVLIVADDMGYGDLGVNGQQKIKTPAIDQLAANGKRFTNYYSGATVCAPSREALLTGHTTANTFIRGNFLTDQQEDPALPQEKLTLAEYLKSYGYQTAIIGKWGLGGEASGPHTQGFDYSFGYLDQIHAHTYYTDHLYENGKKISIPENTGGRKSVYSADLMIERSLKYLDTVGSQQPFFMYLAITLPHGGYDLLDEGTYANENWNPVFKKYAAMITKLDRGVGLVVDKLNAQERTQNTIIILTSDNGANPQFARFFNSNSIFRGGKRDAYDGGIHVPLIVSWPGHIKPNTSSDFVCAAWDLFPTVADVLKTKPPAAMDGISLLPSLTDNRVPASRPPLYWEYYEYNYNWNKPGASQPRNWLDSKAIRDGKWKAVMNNVAQPNGGKIELYDLSTDPSESVDLAGKYPLVVQKMQQLFDSRSNENSSYFPYKKNKL